MTAKTELLHQFMPCALFNHMRISSKSDSGKLNKNLCTICFSTFGYLGNARSDSTITVFYRSLCLGAQFDSEESSA